MGLRAESALTAARVRGEKKPGRYADAASPGLYLQVRRTPSGAIARSWLFRYMLAGKTVSTTGKPISREMGLGPTHTVTLAQARELAAEKRRLLLQRIDPIEARDAHEAGQRLEAARLKSFRECAEAYIAAKRAGWKNDKHAAQWENTLETYAYPTLGDLPVASIDAELVLRVLEPIWETKNETASRLRGRIESILGWATARGYREGLNPARWRDHLKEQLADIKRNARIQHHAAIPFAELPAFLKTLRAQDGVAARALEFTILTAARTAETIGATWPEFDAHCTVWTIPAERMKGKREHRVPLSDRTREILAEMKRLETDFTFPGRGESGLSNMAMLKTLERMKRADLTVHGFRSTFRDWSAERTSFPNFVVEMALAHAISDKVEAAYRRGDLFEKRRQLMQAWADFCEKGESTKVVSINQRTRK